jgi:DNA repair protein RecO (recombination protein O)
MSAVYKAIGINLKSMPLGESDRLLTVLTREHGLIRAVAPGARKHKSCLRGRSSVFAVNELLIVRGRSLDRITQAEGIESFSGLSQDLSKLTASQYLAELALSQALSQQPQAELFALLCKHLRRFEVCSQDQVLVCLIHGIFHLLVTAGLAPQVQTCCLTQQPLAPDFTHSDWRVGFSPSAGGTVNLSEWTSPKHRYSQRRFQAVISESPRQASRVSAESADAIAVFQYAERERLGLHQSNSEAYPNSEVRSKQHYIDRPSESFMLLGALELDVLQRLASAHLMLSDESTFLPVLVSESGSFPDVLKSDQIWLSVERILRHYAQYHLEKPIRSAALVDACFCR